MKRRPVALAAAAAILIGSVLTGGGPAVAGPVTQPGKVAATGAAARHVPAGPSAPTAVVDPAAAAGGRVIVKLGAASQEDVVEAAVRAGGRLVAAQPALRTAVLQLPAGAAERVARVPGVLAIAADRSVRPLGLGFDPATQAGSMTQITRLLGAQDMWRLGFTGQGVDIALIDTGVAPVPGLNDPAKVVVGPDLSLDSQDPDLRYLDAYGHGTHMAGIMAGREVPKANSGQAYAGDSANFYGMAPDARVISVKVAAADGAVDVSQLIAAINWVVQYRNSDGMRIRVLNLSLGTESTQDPRIDPLSWAAENAWRSGIVVVAAAGNSGGRLSGLDNPASNPWVIAVGASDTKGTDTYADDTVPSFSARPSTASQRQIDVVAPGVRVVAPGVPGSDLYSSAPGSAKVGANYLRGSGTSQAAAVVSGAVALALQMRPWMSPEEVKATLRETSTSLGGATSREQGSGQINLTWFRQFSVNWQKQAWPVGTGTGTLEGARGGSRLTLDGVPLTGERDIFGQPWDSEDRMISAEDGVAWIDGRYNGSQWIGGSFAADTSNAAGQTWSGRTWSGRTWSGRTWSGETWSGRTWSGRTWSGRTWSGRTWSDAIWTGWDGGLLTGGVMSGDTWQGKNWS